MRFEIFVALRYLRGKRKTAFISLITIISMTGVSVGVMTLVVAMGIMTGFTEALRDTLLGNRAHVTVFARGGHLAGTADLMDKIKSVPGVKACSPVMQEEALLKHGGKQTGGFVVGIDPTLETSVTDLAANLTTVAGRTKGSGHMPGHKEIVLGYRLAEKIGAKVGDDIGVITGKPTITPFGVRYASQLWLTVCGLSQAKMSEFDTLYGYVDLDTARLLTGRKGADAIQVRLNDPDKSREAAAAIEAATHLGAQAWFETQEGYFQALNQEKMSMFIILVFIVLVAAFNITSTLIMIVMEKRRDVGILRTLGASTRTILALFMIEGLLIGSGGAAIGLGAGMLLGYYINDVSRFIGNLAGVELFNPTIYFFDGIPVDIVPGDVARIALAAVALTFFAALYPAWSAARLQPVDAMRYE